MWVIVGHSTIFDNLSIMCEGVGGLDGRTCCPQASAELHFWHGNMSLPCQEKTALTWRHVVTNNFFRAPPSGVKKFSVPLNNSSTPNPPPPPTPCCIQWTFPWRWVFLIFPSLLQKRLWQGRNVSCSECNISACQWGGSIQLCYYQSVLASLEGMARKEWPNFPMSRSHECRVNPSCALAFC